MNSEQYGFICSRRQSFDNSYGKRLPFAIATQAFFLSACFDSKAEPTNSLILAIFSAIVGLATILLMARHRFWEIEDANRLREFELQHVRDGYSVLHGQRKVRFSKRSILNFIPAYRLWLCVLGSFLFLEIYAIYYAARMSRAIEPNVKVEVQLVPPLSRVGAQIVPRAERPTGSR